MRPESDIKARIFNVVFALFFLRIIFLIVVPPYIGIANNGDFQRLSQSVGIDYAENPWESKNHDDYFFNYVTNDYIYIDPIDNGWHQVFEVFPQIAIWLSNRISNGHFDLRFLGVVNALVYCAAVYVLISSIRIINSGWSYALLGIVIIVLSDSYIIQYCNSFYTEIGTASASILFWGLMLLGFFVIRYKSTRTKTIYIIDNT